MISATLHQFFCSSKIVHYGTNVNNLFKRPVAQRPKSLRLSIFRERSQARSIGLKVFIHIYESKVTH